MYKNMTYGFLSFLFYVGMIISSGTHALADSTSTTPADGSNDSSASTTQNLLWYRHREGSALISKIALLPDQVESSIKMPVLFGVKITDLSPNFGDPRPNGRTHTGEDIIAVGGTPIVSPTKAVVLKMGTGESEGNYVYTANPGGETYVYMHLDAFGEGIAEGVALEQGSLVGYVGNTGNASGGLSHLHFEIHNSSDVAIDPFPRLTSEFTLSDKIAYLSTIFSNSNNKPALSLLLATYFKSTFTDALAQNIVIPASIQVLLPTIPNTPISKTTVILPLGELVLGSSGNDVKELQQNLIAKGQGSATTKLVQVGATGYFGIITQNALIEYQTLMNITPNNGYYDSRTKNILLATTLGISTTTLPIITIPVMPSSITSTPFIFTKNLSKGITEDDVLLLQKYLNTHGFIIASSGSGSLGNETTYFGSATQKSVINFQVSKNITPSVGFVGVITRGYLH
jgi:peptidoglycan hydrolase-like protein with peptidoglycan-binding domain